jgi:transketolase
VRRAFVESLVELASKDERIVLLTGDLGFAALEPFSERFPGRFVNVGVSEQNMVGVATGLAEAGLTPYVYSIATFASMRAYEFVRNGPVLHDLPVRIVGMGEGFDYGHNGMTHYALEDVALMRVQPGLAVVAPAGDRQVDAALQAIQRLPGPAYLRLSKQSLDSAKLPDWFELGRAQQIGHGGDITIVALGAMASTALAARECLAAHGVTAAVTVVSCVSPPPVEDLVSALSSASVAISLEAHYVTGGLGSLLAEVIAEQGLKCRLLRAGIRGRAVGMSGERHYMHQCLQLSAEQVAETALAACARSAIAGAEMVAL